MSRHDRQRLADIVQAMEAIGAHLRRGPEDDPLSDGLVFDAVRVRLIEIGEAVKDLDQAVLEREPALPWRSIAGMRDRLAHRYFDTDHAIVTATCQRDLPELRAAVERLLLVVRDDG